MISLVCCHSWTCWSSKLFKRVSISIFPPSAGAQPKWVGLFTFLFCVLLRFLSFFFCFVQTFQKSLNFYLSLLHWKTATLSWSFQFFFFYLLLPFISFLFCFVQTFHKLSIYIFLSLHWSVASLRPVGFSKLLTTRVSSLNISLSIWSVLHPLADLLVGFLKLHTTKVSGLNISLSIFSKRPVGWFPQNFQSSAPSKLPDCVYFCLLLDYS